MTEWKPPAGSVDQISDPDDEDPQQGAKEVYNDGAIKALQAVVMSINAGASLSQIHQTCVETIQRLEAGE